MAEQSVTPRRSAWYYNHCHTTACNHLMERGMAMERPGLTDEYLLWEQPVGTTRRGETLTQQEVLARFPWLACLLWWASIGGGPLRLTLLVVVTTRRQLVVLHHEPSQPDAISQVHLPAPPPDPPPAPRRYRVASWRPGFSEKAEVYDERVLRRQILPATVLAEDEVLSELRLHNDQWLVQITLLESQVAAPLTGEPP